jgi:hypothetical protein
MGNDSDLSKIRPVTKHLWDAIWFDSYPAPAAYVDFGIDTDDHFLALYNAVRAGDIDHEQLDAVLGDGAKITALVNSVEGCNPKGLVFKTDWDFFREAMDEQRTKSAEPQVTKPKQKPRQRERGIGR